MATISIEIPDDQLSRVTDALCAMGHYKSNLGISKTNFARSELHRLVKERVLDYERRSALAAVPFPPPLDM